MVESDKIFYEIICYTSGIDDEQKTFKLADNIDESKCFHECSVED